MNNSLFFLSLALVLIVFLMRKKIVEYLFEQYDIHIESEIIVYITSILFIALIIVGMLFDNTKAKYNNISKSYENMKPNPQNKPHRYFDIDFDSIFPKF